MNAVKQDAYELRYVAEIEGSIVYWDGDVAKIAQLMEDADEYSFVGTVKLVDPETNRIMSNHPVCISKLVPVFEEVPWYCSEREHRAKIEKTFLWNRMLDTLSSLHVKIDTVMAKLERLEQNQ